MILYNMRNRGPYEYDKFALNIFQIHNAITLGEMQELRNVENNKDSLLWQQREIDATYNRLFGDEKVQGIAEQQYLKFYRTKGE